MNKGTYDCSPQLWLLQHSCDHVIMIQVAWQPACNCDSHSILQSHDCHLQYSLLASDKQNQWGSWQKVANSNDNMLQLCVIHLTMATGTATTAIISWHDHMTRFTTMELPVQITLIKRGLLAQLLDTFDWIFLVYCVLEMGPQQEAARTVQENLWVNRIA